MQDGLLDQPPGHDLSKTLRLHTVVALGGYALRMEPPEVRIGERNERIALPLLPRLIVGADQALGDEQRHLRVVREPPLGPAVGRDESGNACRPVRPADLVDRFEFHPGAELIADRPAKQRAPDARGVGRVHSFS